MSFVSADLYMHLAYFNYRFAYGLLHPAFPASLTCILGGGPTNVMYFDYIHTTCYTPLYPLFFPLLPFLLSYNSLPSTFLSSFLDSTYNGEHAIFVSVSSLFSSTMTISRSLPCFFANDKILFCFMVAYIYLYVHLSAIGHLGWFHILPFVSDVALGTQIFL